MPPTTPAYDAKSYALHRPTYPADLYAVMYEQAGLQQYRTALDVATGTGQVAQTLAEKFDRVIGTDISASQLEEAVRLPNVSYLETPAETLDGVQDGSIDLITVAEAFHWFDHGAFYKACRRVLRPDGVLVVWGYSFEEILPGPAISGFVPPGGAAEANKIFAQYHTDLLGPYWAPGRAFLNQQYAGLEPGTGDFESVQRLHTTRMDRESSLDDLIGYLTSWSPYVAYLEAHPDRENPLIAFKARIAEALGIEDSARPGTIVNSWPLFGFVAKGPVPLV